MKKIKLLAIFVFCVFILTASFISCKCTSTTTQTNKTSSYDCYKSADSTLEPVSGFTTKFFSAELNKKGSYDDENDTQNRTFSLKDYQDYKEIPEGLKEDLFFVVRKSDDSDFINKTAIQLCDENNQTNILLPKAKNNEYPSIKIAQFIYGSAMPNKPGVYRVDGFISVDGQWQLVDREMITISE